MADVPIIFVPRARYTDRTNALVPLLPLALRALAILGIEWTTLKFIEDAPLLVRVSTFLCSAFMLAVLEKRDWLRFKGRSYFPVAAGILVLLYCAIVGYSYVRFEADISPDGAAAHFQSKHPPSDDASLRSSEAANNLIESLQSALASTRQTLEATRIERDQTKRALVITEAQKSTLIEWLQKSEQERDEAKQERDAAQKRLALTGEQMDSSPLLKLTDAKRWRFITSFLDWPGSPNGPPHCYAWVAVKPNSASASALWAELSPLLIHSNWQVTVGWESRPFFNNGIMVLSGTGPGDPFICGTRLTELMQNQMPTLTTMRNNQITPALEQCKYECVEIRVGDDVAH